MKGAVKYFLNIIRTGDSLGEECCQCPRAFTDFSVWSALCKTLMDIATTAVTLELQN
jgi:hypothetical protein